MLKKLIEDAKEIGYKSIKLDTSITQIEAQKLYESLGFEQISPFYDLPKNLKNGLFLWN